jgi:hypothetical protein
MDNRSSVSVGGGGGTLIWIALIVLKAMGKIGMSWFWVVTSIIWAPLAIIIFWLLVVLVIAAIAS